MLNKENSNGSSPCQMGDACCKLNGGSAKRTKSCQTEGGSSKKSRGTETEKLFDPKEFAPYDPSQELIFPPKLKVKRLEQALPNE